MRVQLPALSSFGSRPEVCIGLAPRGLIGSPQPVAASRLVRSAAVAGLRPGPRCSPRGTQRTSSPRVTGFSELARKPPLAALTTSTLFVQLPYRVFPASGARLSWVCLAQHLAPIAFGYAFDGLLLQIPCLPYFRRLPSWGSRGQSVVLVPLPVPSLHSLLGFLSRAFPLFLAAWCSDPIPRQNSSLRLFVRSP